MKKAKLRKKEVPRTEGAKLPLGTFEEWLRVQDVKPAVAIREVEVPLDSYETWIRKQTRKQ